MNIPTDMSRLKGFHYPREIVAYAVWAIPSAGLDDVTAKPPFGGPEQVLAYLSRYTYRVAISNHRLVSADANTVILSQTLPK